MNGGIYFLAGILLAVLILLFFKLRDKKYRKKRITALTAYLETAVAGHETALSHVEDEFSRLEDELYKTVSELQIAKEWAVDERQKQADNLADIAHQLKTPLTSMSLMTQLLSETASSRQKPYITRIDNQLERLNWLTSSLLTMSRLDAGTIQFEPEPTSFEPLALQASESFEEMLRRKHQTLTITGSDCVLMCDSHWTAEALLNLVKNCSEHTPEGGEITMAASATLLYGQIVISDNGPGFLPEEIPNLFRRFYHGRHAGKDSVGIGLALCRGIIERQGGMIQAENVAAGGARFIIRFYPN